MVSLFWSLWKDRSLKVWDDVTETVAQMIDISHQLLEDWAHANATTNVAMLQFLGPYVLTCR